VKELKELKSPVGDEMRGGRWGVYGDNFRLSCPFFFAAVFVRVSQRDVHRLSLCRHARVFSRTSVPEF
jgi:hypothetical protein